MESLSKSAFAEAARAATRSRAAFELKGVVTPVTVMRLRTKDLNLVERQLKARLIQTPGFFQDAPVVLDLAELGPALGGFPLSALVHVLRSMRVVPVGATGVDDADRELVRASGLSVVQTAAARASSRDTTAVTARPTPIADPPPEPPPRAELPPPPRTNPHRPPLVVRSPVRSGQEIYARHTDLIVLAAVNPGAQIYADGHVHVYATLRGRAMAGAQGFPEARIYVQRLEAELVSIAGAYLQADEIPYERRGKPCQVFLERGECKVGAL
jgi:septum site-determining protein MinC